MEINNFKMTKSDIENICKREDVGPIMKALKQSDPVEFADIIVSYLDNQEEFYVSDLDIAVQTLFFEVYMDEDVDELIDKFTNSFFISACEYIEERIAA